MPEPYGPFPTPTPGSEEMEKWRLAQLRAAEESWERELSADLMACEETGGSDECITVVGFEVYEHYGISVLAAASARQNNPLPSDSFGFRMLAPNAAANWMDELNPAFLEEIDMDWGHHTNYEPAFLNLLKQLNGWEYKEALKKVQEHEEFTRYFEEVGFEQIFGSGYEYRPDPLE